MQMAFIHEEECFISVIELFVHSSLFRVFYKNEIVPKYSVTYREISILLNKLNVIQ